MLRDLTFIIGVKTTLAGVKVAIKANSLYFSGVKMMFSQALLRKALLTFAIHEQP